LIEDVICRRIRGRWFLDRERRHVDRGAAITGKAADEAIVFSSQLML
jgi:hypothetical protein